MDERRIEACLEIVEALSRGDFRVAAPAGGDDDLSRLGQALGRLAGSLRDRFERLDRLVQIVAGLTPGQTLPDVLGRIYESFGAVIPYDRIGCALLEEAGGTVRAVWARSTRSPVGIGVGYRGRLEGSSLSEILRTRRPRILNDLAAYLALHPGSDSTRRIVEEGMRSSLTCPLVLADRPLGFLFFSSTRLQAYDEAHVQVFQQIADHVSAVVEATRLYEELLAANRQLETTNEELTRLATVDALTGLANRRSFDEALEREWRRAQRSGAGLALVLADIDHFKAHNDVHGHPQGDACLQGVAAALATAARRAGELVARYGGDEFAILLPGAGPEEAAVAAERARGAVAAMRIPGGGAGGGGGVTVSLGVASTEDRKWESAADLVRAADLALYEAKAAGRGRIALSRP